MARDTAMQTSQITAGLTQASLPYIERQGSAAMPAAINAYRGVQDAQIQRRDMALREQVAQHGMTMDIAKAELEAMLAEEQIARWEQTAYFHERELGIRAQQVAVRAAEFEFEQMMEQRRMSQRDRQLDMALLEAPPFEGEDGTLQAYTPGPDGEVRLRTLGDNDPRAMAIRQSRELGQARIEMTQAQAERYRRAPSSTDPRFANLQSLVDLETSLAMQIQDARDDGRPEDEIADLEDQLREAQAARRQVTRYTAGQAGGAMGGAAPTAAAPQQPTLDPRVSAAFEGADDAADLWGDLRSMPGLADDETAMLATLRVMQSDPAYRKKMIEYLRKNRGERAR